MLNLEKSLAAFNEAKTLMPGGVNSPVRSYANVDCNPPFIAKAKGDRSVAVRAPGGHRGVGDGYVRRAEFARRHDGHGGGHDLGILQ